MPDYLLLKWLLSLWLGKVLASGPTAQVKAAPCSPLRLEVEVEKLLCCSDNS